MSCTKNQKRFLLFKYEGDHDMELIRLGRFMDTSANFTVLTQCSLCGIQKKRSFVSETELIRMGIPIEEIAKHRNTIF